MEETVYAENIVNMQWDLATFFHVICSWKQFWNPNEEKNNKDNTYFSFPHKSKLIASNYLGQKPSNVYCDFHWVK